MDLTKDCEMLDHSTDPQFVMEQVRICPYLTDILNVILEKLRWGNSMSGDLGECECSLCSLSDL